MYIYIYILHYVYTPFMIHASLCTCWHLRSMSDSSTHVFVCRVRDLWVHFMNDVTCTYKTCALHMSDSFTRDMTYLWMTWLIYEWHDVFMKDMTCVWMTWLMYEWRDLLMNACALDRHTNTYTYRCVRLSVYIHMCECVCLYIYICVSVSIYTDNLTHLRLSVYISDVVCVICGYMCTRQTH